MDIALALGGGGVKGNAHSGVLRVLEREGFRIRAIAGTSAGGLWGCLYAAGYKPDDIDMIMSQFNPDTIYERDDGDAPAMLGLGGIRDMLAEKLGKLKFEHLSIPFAVTAVDINSAELVILREGAVADAVLATIALPGVFPPKTIAGKTYVDGGVLSPVPVGTARLLAPDLPVVAVVLSSPLDGWDGPESPGVLDSIPFLAPIISKLRFAQAFNVFMRSINISGTTLTDLSLQIEKPEVIIRPQVPRLSLLDEVDVKKVALLGEQATEQALPELRKAVSWQGRVYRRYLRNINLSRR